MSSNLQKVVSEIGNIKKFENIKKSKHDQRLYRGLQLNNGLKALLISDPLTDKSAASLAVNVGEEYSNFYC